MKASLTTPLISPLTIPCTGWQRCICICVWCLQRLTGTGLAAQLYWQSYNSCYLLAASCVLSTVYWELCTAILHISLLLLAVRLLSSDFWILSWNPLQTILAVTSSSRSDTVTLFAYYMFNWLAYSLLCQSQTKVTTVAATFVNATFVLVTIPTPPDLLCFS